MKALAVRSLTLLVVVALSASCAEDDDSFATGSIVAGLPRAAADAQVVMTSELARDERPEVAPVKTLAASYSNSFNAFLFLTAFDPGLATCDPSSLTWPAGVPEPAEEVSTTMSATVDNLGDGRAFVELSEEGEVFQLPVIQLDNRWVIADDACKWFELLLGGSADSEAKIALRTALTAAKVHYIDVGDYSTLTPASLQAIEPSLAYDVVANADADTVGIGDLGPLQLVLVRQSAAGAFFCVAETELGATFGRSAVLADVDTAAECTQGWE